ncbi:unnamed protein product, partial [Larinioides sclopetarius]
LKPLRRRSTPAASSSSLLTLYQRLLRYIRRLLSARRDVSYEEYYPHPPRYRPLRINALCRLTNFSRSEIKLIYQGFKQVCPTGVVNENTFKNIFSSYFPQGDGMKFISLISKPCGLAQNSNVGPE